MRTENRVAHDKLVLPSSQSTIQFERVRADSQRKTRTHTPIVDFDWNVRMRRTPRTFYGILILSSTA